MHEGCRDRETFRKRKNTRAAGECILRFPKVEQHPKCMDHAILLGKPFGNCFIKYLEWNNDILRGILIPARLLTNQIACFTVVII
jgi:hypothetical protein